MRVAERNRVRLACSARAGVRSVAPCMVSRSVRDAPLAVRAILSVVSRVLAVVCGSANPRVIAPALLLTPSALLLAGCGSSHRAARRSSPASSSRRVLLRGLENAQAYAAGSRLYIAQRVSRPGAEV